MPPALQLLVELVALLEGRMIQQNGLTAAFETGLSSGKAGGARASADSLPAD